MYTVKDMEASKSRPAYVSQEYFAYANGLIEELPMPEGLVQRKDYKQRMEEEGLFHKDQDYKNIQLTIGDETRYVPFALAHTDGESQIVILPPERMPYDTPWEFVLRHEREHCVQIVSEYMTDLRAASRLRDGIRNDAVRVKY